MGHNGPEVMRWLRGRSIDPHAPYLTHYQLVSADGEVYAESGVPVVFFEDGPAVAKAALLNRIDSHKGWRPVTTAR